MPRPSPSPLIQVPKVGVILTGGTIESCVAPGDAHLSVGKGSHLVEGFFRGGLPALKRVKFPARRPYSKLSEDVQPTDWLKVADAARDLYENEGVSAIVVGHGTDTMVYTSAALSFLLADLPLVIVHTGANHPAVFANTDAPTNVADAYVAAVELAKAQRFGSYTSFSGIPGKPSVVLLGVNARKRQADGNGFKPINRDEIGTVVKGVFGLNDQLPPMRPLYPRRDLLDAKVLTIPIRPGYNLREQATNVVIPGGYRGVLVELYPSSTAPNGGGPTSLPEFVKLCGDDVVVVGVVSNPTFQQQKVTYETTATFVDMGLLLLDDMLPETAYAKLMWALGNSKNAWEARVLMKHDFVGERSRPTTVERAVIAQPEDLSLERGAELSLAPLPGPISDLSAGA